MADPQAISSQTVIRARESTENIPAARRVIDIEKRIHHLYPNIAPLTFFVQRAGVRRATNSKFQWIEKDLAARWSQVNNGAGYADNATAVVVDVGDYFSVGDIVNVVRTGEKMRVTAVNISTETLTVVRAVGSTAAAALLDNDDLQIIGNSYAEGAGLGAEKSHTESYVFNYTQILRHPFGVTGTQEQSENYTGNDRTRLRAEKLVEHKLDLERTALFGERNIDTGSTDNPRRYTGGALYYMTSNITSSVATLTEGELETSLESIFQPTVAGDGRVLLASPLLVSVIDQLGFGKLMTVPSDKTMGISITRWITSHGEFNIIKHRLLDNGLGGTGYGGYGLFVAPSLWKYVTLGNRGTKLRTDVQAPGDDAFTDEYLAEIGWQVQNPKAMGQLTGVTG